jgi:hypothetical protein
MNKLTNYVIGAVAVIALIAAFAYDQSPKLITGAQGPQGPRGEQGPAGRDGVDGKDGVTTVITKTEAPKLGSVTGPDFYGPYRAFNNVKGLADRSTFKASTTPCAFLFTATSSLKSFDFMVSSTSAQATTYTLATSTSFNATTSVIASFVAVAANGQSAQSWNAVDRQVGTISPNTYVVLGVTGVTGGFPGGSCQYEASIY